MSKFYRLTTMCFLDIISPPAEGLIQKFKKAVGLATLYLQLYKYQQLAY